MSDFDKVAYWKQRMKEKLEDNFNSTLVVLNDIRATVIHLTGKDPEEMKLVYADIGKFYDKIGEFIANIGKKQPESKKKGN